MRHIRHIRRFFDALFCIIAPSVGDNEMFKGKGENKNGQSSDYRTRLNRRTNCSSMP